MIKVLLVEDSPFVLESISEALNLLGFETIKTTDGQHALDFLKTTSFLPDIIVSDILMPFMNGFDFLEEVRKNPRWDGIPFVFLTARDQNEDKQRGKKLLVDDYIVKPVAIQDLVSTIHSKLGRISQLKQNVEQQLNQARSEWIRVLSHELRTPLSYLATSTELLAEGLDNNAAYTDIWETLNLMRAGTKRMHRLINQFLLLMEIDSGKMKSELTRTQRRCDLGEIIQSAIQNLKYDINYSNFILFDKPTFSITVHGLYQVLISSITEIIYNAIIYSSQEQDIHITLEKADEQAVITVEDFGIGISPTDLSRLGQRFVQINREKQEQQGIGLGLSLVYETIALHGGTCDIDSTLGEGTVVTIKLPLVA